MNYHAMCCSKMFRIEISTTIEFIHLYKQVSFTSILLPSQINLAYHLRLLAPGLMHKVLYLQTFSEQNILNVSDQCIPAQWRQPNTFTDTLNFFKVVFGSDESYLHNKCSTMPWYLTTIHKRIKLQICDFKYTFGVYILTMILFEPWYIWKKNLSSKKKINLFKALNKKK